MTFTRDAIQSRAGKIAIDFFNKASRADYMRQELFFPFMGSNSVFEVFNLFNSDLEYELIHDFRSPDFIQWRNECMTWATDVEINPDVIDRYMLFDYNNKYMLNCIAHSLSELFLTHAINEKDGNNHEN